MSNADDSRPRAGPPPDRDPPTLVLWTRRECHLCDVAKEALRSLQRELEFRIEERDVDARERWAARHGDEVPVGTVGGTRVFKYRVDADRLARALRRRGAPDRPTPADEP